MRRTSARRVAGLAGLAISYFVIASASLKLTRFDGEIAYIWPATSLLLAYLLRTSLHKWAWPLALCAVSSLLASALFGAGPQSAPLRALILMGEAALGAMLLQRFLPERRYFDSIHRLALFAALVGIAMPMASATAAAAVAAEVFGEQFWPNWLAWLSIHALGALTFTPIFVLLMRPTMLRRLDAFHPRNGVLDLTVLLVAIAVDCLVFAQARWPLLFLPLLPLMLLTFRMGRLGAAIGIAAIAIAGAVGTTHGFGPVALIRSMASERALFFQFYLAAAALLVLPVAAELTRRKRLERRLRDSEAMFRMMAEQSADVLMDVSVDGRIRYISPSITKLNGCAPAALVGRSALVLVHPDDRVLATTAHSRALSRPEEAFAYQHRGLKRNGDTIWMETLARAAVDGEGRVLGVINTARDIAQRKASEDKLISAANSDVLTGLANRRTFDERLHRAVHATKVRAHSGCVAILDIDFFKRVNDTYGHPVGDQVLKDVAAVLQPVLRSVDTVARIGGEEFGLILWDLRIEDADALCAPIRETVEALRIAVGSTAISVTVSIGLANIDAYATVGDLLGAADAALYRAKGDGRNCLRLAA